MIYNVLIYLNFYVMQDTKQRRLRMINARDQIKSEIQLPAMKKKDKVSFSEFCSTSVFKIKH